MKRPLLILALLIGGCVIWPGNGPHKPQRFEPAAPAYRDPVRDPDSVGSGRGSTDWPGRGPHAPFRFTSSTYARPPATVLNNPPDGLEMAPGGGQWLTEADESRVVRLTGLRSIWLKNTANAAVLQHSAAHMVPVEAGKRYKAWAVFEADDITAGKTVASSIRWMAADKITEVGSTVIYSAVATAINTWQRAEVIDVAPAGATFARLRFGRTGTSFNAYYDEVDMLPAIPQWEVWIDIGTPAQSIATATDTTILFDTTNNTDVTYSATTGKVTIVVPGFYYVSAGITVAAMIDNKQAFWIARVNGTTDNYLEQRTNYAGGGVLTNNMMLRGSILLSLNAGDTVEMVLNHNNGVNKSIVSGKVQSRFSGYREM